MRRIIVSTITIMLASVLYWVIISAESIDAAHLPDNSITIQPLAPPTTAEQLDSITKEAKGIIEELAARGQPLATETIPKENQGLTEMWATDPPIYPPITKKPVDVIRLPMAQCLNREELKALMGQCWADAIDIATVPDTKDKESDWVFVGSRATLAAAIFRVRADNIQSGREPYVREWAVNSGEGK